MISDYAARLLVAEPGFFKESGCAHSYLEDDPVPEEVATLLARACFVLIKPDALLSGKAGQIFEFLESFGLQIVDSFLVQKPQEWHFEELYKYNLTLMNSQNQISVWWLNRQIYTYGPSLAAVLVAPENGPSAVDLVARIKGPSTPRLCKPEHLRWRFHATNSALNLFHASDGPISSWREWAIFRSKADRIAALMSVLQTDRALNPWHSLAAGFEHSKESFEFYSTLISVKLRALAAACRSLGPLADKLERIYLEALGRKANNPTQEVQLIDRRLTAESKALELINRKSIEFNYSVKLILALNKIPIKTPNGIDDLFRIIKCSDVHLNTRESMVLSTSIRYMTDNRRDQFSR